MPRKAFVADLAAVSSNPSAFKNVASIEAGDDDGELRFVYSVPDLDVDVQISVLVPELGNYPGGHSYHVFADDDAPFAVAQALQDCPSLLGKPLPQALSILSHNLSKATREPDDLDSDGDSQMQDSQALDSDLGDGDGHGDGDDEDDGDGDLENEDWTLDEQAPPAEMKSISVNKKEKSPTAIRVRQDLRAAKAAGFKVSVVGSLHHNGACCISVACRIAKLGISEEAMEAWDIKPSEYLTLLIYFASGYKSTEAVQAMDPAFARQSINMGVVIGSHTYKPKSMSEAIKALGTKTKAANGKSDGSTSKEGGLRPAFISRPLNELLNDRFVRILQLRLGESVSWTVAERIYNEWQGKGASSASTNLKQDKIPEVVPEALPTIVTADEAARPVLPRDISLPLVVMQFVLRHFVRCTEFCLVCHCKTGVDFEAIKPYVCSSPLCLFQYMSLGFGPSIEHEILTQPMVVDLLISFCYAGAYSNSLDSYPQGLALNVPDPRVRVDVPTAIKEVRSYAGAGMPWTGTHGAHRGNIDGLPKATPKLGELAPPHIEAKLDLKNFELLLDASKTKSCPLRQGDWVTIQSQQSSKKDSPLANEFCRVTSTVLFPTVSLSSPIRLAAPGENNANASWPPIKSGQYVQVTVQRFELNFDNLEPNSKNESILQLLELLPSVLEMKDYLQTNEGKTLADWVERLPPACLGLLRWIIASNRSCILQVDQLETGNSEVAKPSERVQGVPGYLQFRFAMGAPDKEQRFQNSIKQITAQLTHPTIFAWHGSPLGNWHSIIRQGLHFNKTSHGRAYGNGVYHAKDFVTSGGYSRIMEHRMLTSASDRPAGSSDTWPMSKLLVTSAVALSEIVNAPKEFVSQSPFYVINQLEWIQTRYLFVNSALREEDQKSTPFEKALPLTNVFPQDPRLTPNGPTQTPIVLPLSAVPKSRQPHRKNAPKGKGKASSSAEHSDSESVRTDDEDRSFLLEPEDEASAKKLPSVPSTPFSPSDISNLPLISAPAYATPTATKRLQRDFLLLQKLQQGHADNGTLADIGWYAREDHLTNTGNLYQWIVELHSFPLTLPLAMDMQKYNITSVVLEIRFHSTYPISPPFVRVVRPRFLSFQAGGGGHVTAGGSICMDLLTNSGWTAVSDMESVLLQIRMALMSTDPRPARIEMGRGSIGEYGVGEAVDAFIRAARAHGWAVPESLQEISRMV